jgi:hypothetical protein
MTRKLISLTAAAALSLAGIVYLQAKEPDEHGPKHEHGPGPHHIIDQTKPQLAAIHKEAMEKAHALLENAGAQIRPLLTPEQQTKYDAMKKAHEDMRKAMEEMHDAKAK